MMIHVVVFGLSFGLSSELNFSLVDVTATTRVVGRTWRSLGHRYDRLTGLRAGKPVELEPVQSQL